MSKHDVVEIDVGVSESQTQRTVTCTPVFGTGRHGNVRQNHNHHSKQPFMGFLV